MVDDFKHKIKPSVDIVEPVFLGNFCNNRNAVCRDLRKEASLILKECGWERDFAMYYYGDLNHVRLYLRIAYVGAFHIDGTWDEIKLRLPHIVPMVIQTANLQQEKDIGMYWIDRSVARLEWEKMGNPCLACLHY